MKLKKLSDITIHFEDTGDTYKITRFIRRSGEWKMERQQIRNDGKSR